MVEIGGRPILWHIMKIYSAYGLNDFVICGGYKFNVIKSYFRDYMFSCSDVTLDLQRERIEIHRNQVEPWTITLVDTGENTMTGGRVKRIRPYVGDEAFCLTYGDGVSNIDVRALIDFHKRSRVQVTVTAVAPPGRFGVLNINAEDSLVDAFREKSNADVGYINGGFFIVEPNACDYIEDDDTVWERGPLETLAHDKQLAAYRHNGFWQNMDTLRDKHVLEELWQTGNAPWKIW
jgi:glucose-1-phosphate cytidylyltransferase